MANGEAVVMSTNTYAVTYTVTDPSSVVRGAGAWGRGDTLDDARAAALKELKETFGYTKRGAKTKCRERVFTEDGEGKSTEVKA